MSLTAGSKPGTYDEQAVLRSVYQGGRFVSATQAETQRTSSGTRSFITLADFHTRG
jgi:hypothetical protein